MGVGEVETNAANLSVCSRTLVQSPVLCSGWIEGGRPPAAPGRGRGSWCWTSCLHLKISCSVSSIGDIYTTTTTFSHLPTLITTTPSPSALTSQSNKTSEVKSESHCQTGGRREELIISETFTCEDWVRGLLFLLWLRSLGLRETQCRQWSEN